MALLRHHHGALAWMLALNIGVVAEAHSQPRFAFDDTRTVLPKTVVPSHYALSLQLDPRREQFTGRAVIDVQTRQRVTAIVLHARGLKSQRVQLHSGGLRRTLRVAADGRSAKAPDSLLKLAMSLERLGQKDQACLSYGELGTKFPNAPAHVKARAQSERQRIGCS